MLMFSMFPIIVIYCFYNEKNTNKNYLLEKQSNFCFISLGACGSLRYGCFEKHDDKSLYHFYMPVSSNCFTKVTAFRSHNSGMNLCM